MFTVTLLDVVVPPGPVHDILNVADAVRLPVAWEPEVPRAPGLGHGPKPVVHDVAPDEDQVRVVGALYCTGFGEALKETTGGAGTQAAFATQRDAELHPDGLNVPTWYIWFVHPPMLQPTSCQPVWVQGGGQADCHVQFVLQPVPHESELPPPSSHCSPDSTTPLPQTAGQSPEHELLVSPLLQIKSPQ